MHCSKKCSGKKLNWFYSSDLVFIIVQSTNLKLNNNAVNQRKNWLVLVVQTTENGDNANKLLETNITNNSILCVGITWNNVIKKKPKKSFILFPVAL